MREKEAERRIDGCKGNRKEELVLAVGCNGSCAEENVIGWLWWRKAGEEEGSVKGTRGCL